MKYIFLSLMICSLSCAGLERERVLDRAPFDLSCDRKDIKVQDLGSRVYGVTGCGKKATYVISTPDGSAILNSVDGQPTKQNTP